MNTEENILIIRCENAHNDVLKTVQLKDEIDRITGAYAIVYIPVTGAVAINNFREQEQFQFGLASIQFNSSETTYAIPVEFGGIQGRIPEEENNSNYNKQLLFTPIPINKKVEPNSNLKIKFRNSLAEFSYKFNLKIILTYKDK